MTGGTVVVLGPVGLNLGAGMTGGEVFVYDPEAALPARVNTEFVTVRGRGEMDFRVWERGSGETMACGTGACAGSAAARPDQLEDMAAVARVVDRHRAVLRMHEPGQSHQAGGRRDLNYPGAAAAQHAQRERATVRRRRAGQRDLQLCGRP